jgi:hypothetical protein
VVGSVAAGVVDGEDGVMVGVMAVGEAGAWDLGWVSPTPPVMAVTEDHTATPWVGVGVTAMALPGPAVAIRTVGQVGAGRADSSSR